MKNLKKLFIAVIHVNNWKQAHTEAEKVLVPDGAHGAVFICHNGNIPSTGDDPNLFDIAEEAKKSHPEYLIGVNCLDLNNFATLQEAKKYSSLDFVWTDHGGIIQNPQGTYLDPAIARALDKKTFNYYGSEWFKGRKKPDDPELVFKEAIQHFDMVVTSGDATGKPPALEKIQAIRSWIGPHTPLANASGISAQNITSYLPLVDVFFIATNICIHDGLGENGYIIDSDKVASIRQKIDHYEKGLV